MNPLFEDLKSPLEFFTQWETERADEIFLRQPYGDTWKEVTYKEAGTEARRLANALKTLGFEKGDHIGIISKNCAHWIIADVAIMMAECVSVPFYPSLTSDQLAEVLDKSDCKGLFAGKLEEWDEKKQGVPEDTILISFPHYEGNALVSGGHDWDQLVNQHQPLQSFDLPELDDLWSILFTSGTTGSPKGVMHTYRNVALVARNEILNNALDTFSVDRTRYFSFLPMNHIAERAAVELGALMSGGSISFAESLDTFVRNLQETEPTFFFAVPRIWLKFQLGVLAKMPQAKLDRMLKIPIISGIVKKKIRKGLGLIMVKTALTGASLTSENLKQWYRKIGLNLREVYGQTENFGGFTLMPKDHHEPNTVGRPMANAEGKIDPDNGEILMKMPWMMTGYYKDPELTAKTIRDGWLHTGDKGKMTENGYIKVVGRVKDAFKTTKGEFIVPTVIEDKFSKCELIEQICVAGLGIPQPVALLCLSEIAKQKDQQDIVRQLESDLDTVNAQLGNHERISTMIIANEPWSEANSLLTPTMKIRRGAIQDRYGDRLDTWHHEESRIIWEQ
jgi:long-subunit acyl-CoA synthetase (AMP-forming)